MFESTKQMAKVGTCAALIAAGAAKATSGAATAADQTQFGGNFPGVQASAGLLAEARVAFANQEGLADVSDPSSMSGAAARAIRSVLWEAQVRTLSGASDGSSTDSFFDGLAAAQPAAIRGVVNRGAGLPSQPR